MSNQFAPKPTYATNQPATSGKAVAALVLGLLSLAFSCLTAIPAVIVGFLAIGDINRSKGQLTGKGLAITGMVVSLVTPLVTIVIGAIMFALLAPAVKLAQGAAQSMTSQNDMKMVGLAMHNYHDTYNSFPFVGTEEVPMSWRVSLLPYVEEMPLYDQFDFRQPATSPVNAALAARMPEIYGTLLFEHPADRSPIQIPIGPMAGNQPTVRGQGVSIQSLGRGPGQVKPASMANIIDGTSNTAMLVMVRPEALGSQWTRTDADFQVDLVNPASGLFEINGTYLILTADGAMHQVNSDIDPETLSSIMTRDDGNVIMDGLY